MVEEMVCQRGGDGLAADCAALLVELQQAVGAVEVRDSQGEGAAASAGGFQMQSKHQRVEFGVVAGGGGDLGQFHDVFQ
ncbi:hypothetical protein [Nocardia aurea]|uniref:Uncharacterized protein n=1 Tax=Nocardia aurea TaxID=2144174 RepID=A0ABV3FY05_9NOCA